MRFGLMSLPGGREEALADAALAQDAGFDLIATGDHLRHPRNPDAPILDGWSVLAAFAIATRTIRVAMLVSNTVYRHPTVLAKQATTVDHLSEGRLDLGVGAGVYPTDHAMAGVPMWSPAERIGHVRELVRALDLALGGAVSFDGVHYPFREAAVAPRPVQQPRPPIVIGAAGPRMLRLAAELGDRWSAFGGMGVTDEDGFWAEIGRQVRLIDQCCEAVGRDPGGLGRSLLAYRPLAPWAGRDSLARIADRAGSLGFGEVVLYKPSTAEERRFFDCAVTTTIGR